METFHLIVCVWGGALGSRPVRLLQCL